MRAVRLHEPGGPTNLRLDQVPVPVAGPGEALVRVGWAALTRDELDWPVDRLPAVPSYELCGVVSATGAGVDPALVGTEVFALTPFDRDGVAADFATVTAELLAGKPPTLDGASTAALALPGLSAWQLLFDHGGMEKEQRVLVLGAAGGVGQFATQLARLHGAVVIGTASPTARDLATDLGADVVLDPSDRGALDALEPVDLVVDTVGGDLVRRAQARLRAGGRLVSVADEPPASADGASTSTYFVVAPHAGQLAELGRLAEIGDLRVAVDSVFPITAATEAFERVQSTGKHGKVVLQVAGA